MTAIAALWHPGATSPDVATCRDMVAAQARYGPDAADTAALGNAALGRALARLLPEDDHDRQPLIGGDGRFLLVADLRIDNRDELAAMLRLCPATAGGLSDADLLLAAWKRWQDDTFPHIVGSYAFAVFDRSTQRLTIARDALGDRPLFWARTGGRIAVASMPAGLHALPELRRGADIERIARLLAWIPAGERSFHAGIQRVRPGFAVRFDAHGEHRWRHWNPQRGSLRLPSFDAYVEAYREQLDRATAARLRRRETPIATQLSGGWDSSAVTATAAQLLRPAGEHVTAYTSVPAIASPDTRTRFVDEGPLAAAVAAMHPNIDHVLVASPGGSPIATLGRHASLYGRPLLNLCNHVWLDEIHRKARATGARVMLTGAIGNFTISNAPGSLLADYIRAERWGTWLREATGAVRQRRARLRGVLASSFAPWVPGSLWRMIERFGTFGQPRAGLPVGPAWKRRLADEIAADARAWRSADLYAATIAGVSDADPGEYNKGVLAGWGIDLRDPTADRRVVEFMLSLPLDMFLKDGVRRPLARAALADRLPEAILAERKKGLQAADWHIGLTRDLPAVRTLAARIATHPVASEVIDIAYVNRLLDDWPTDGWSDPLVSARYRSALLLALSAGHFLVTA